MVKLEICQSVTAKTIISSRRKKIIVTSEVWLHVLVFKIMVMPQDSSRGPATDTWSSSVVAMLWWQENTMRKKASQYSMLIKSHTDEPQRLQKYVNLHESMNLLCKLLSFHIICYLFVVRALWIIWWGIYKSFWQSVSVLIVSFTITKNH